MQIQISNMVLFQNMNKASRKQKQIKNQKHIDGPMNIPITETGKRIQNYVFNYSDFLGAGNFSKCYKGYHEITNDVVAIKIVELNSLKSKKLQQLLFQEIQILKKLNHPSVLKCYEIFTSNRNCYIITELCNQGNLQNRLKLKKVFDQPQANPIIKDVYDGLVYLGQNNIVHRDLKSANIFLHNGRAKIADFGFAKEIKHNFKDLNIGSPLYMTPQGILHNIYGPKTQVWAIGILVYELFHGASPYILCKTQQELKQRVMIPLNWKQLRKDLSQDIKEFILTCLEINEQTRATIELLGNLGYMRRLAQGPLGYLGTGFELRSPSKSVHLAVNNEDANNFEAEKQRVNNNLRAPNHNPFSREVSRSKNNQRQQVIFRSVDMRGMNNNNSRNQGQYHSPYKRSTFNPVNQVPSKFQINSPGVKRPQMINSLRPMSSHNQPMNQPIYINNNQQNVQAFHPQQQLQIPFSANQNYQYRVFQAPYENVVGMNVMGKSGDVVNGDGIGGNNRVQGQGNRPLSSYNQQQQQQQQQQMYQTFDSIGYNSMNGFFNANQYEPNQNLNLTKTQSQQLGFNTSSNHQRPLSANFNPITDNQSYMFRNRINFKQAIFFIHHCRLVFKFLFLYKQLQCFDEKSYLKIFKYLMSVLSELNRLAQNNGVMADGEKAGLKIKKFKEVNLEYLAKYQKELEERNYVVSPQVMSQQSITVINSTLREVFLKINQQIAQSSKKQYLNSSDQNTIVIGHLCIVIIGSLKQIQYGIEGNNYKKLLQFKLIETILNTPKEEFTMASYKNYKDKFISN